MVDSRYVFWTEEMVLEEAARCRYRHEMNRSAYNKALALGIVKKLKFEKPPTARCDNDAIYIWRAVGEFFNGNPVFKIGVTSARLGTRRIKECSDKNGFTPEIIICTPVHGKATELEGELHLLGDDPKYVGIDGATEFRALNTSQLDVALRLIGANAML